ncbi:MAG TPA: hypothetical protein VH815_09905, partial [Acidobacteriota bacterium]
GRKVALAGGTDGLALKGSYSYTTKVLYLCFLVIITIGLCDLRILCWPVVCESYCLCVTIHTVLHP